MNEKKVFRSKYDSNEKFEVNNINEIKEILKDCNINEINRKMMSFDIKIDNIIYKMYEHYDSNNDVIFKDIHKDYKIKKDGSIKSYKVQVQIEDDVLREKIMNTFPKDFDINSSRYKL